MNLRSVVWLLSLVTVSISPPLLMSAVADEADLVEKPEEEPTEDAMTHFDQGSELYFEQNYSRAIVEFRKSYQLQPHPLTLYNISRSFIGLDQYRRAYDSAVDAAAMDESMPPNDDAKNAGIIAATGSLLEARNRAGAIEKSSPPDKKDTADEKDVAPLTDELHLREDETWKPGAAGWAGIATLGVGAVALGSSARINSLIEDQKQEVQQANLSAEERTRHYDDIRTWQTRGQILLFSGLGLTVAGGSLLAWDILSDDGDEPETDLAISPTIDEPGLRIRLGW